MGVWVSDDKKKWNQRRFCCDLRYLNSIAVNEVYKNRRNFYSSLLRISFSASAFSKTGRQKNRFFCELDILQWERMLFGIKRKQSPRLDQKETNQSCAV